MNKIKHKLQSKQGASLLIAMVYLIFAVFIGGSVLAAASANGYRIEHLSDQQDYLDQRSAAMLLADEMKSSDYASISLDARFNTITRQKIIIKENNDIINVGDPWDTYTLTFKANSNGKMDALSRVMFESAVLRYLSVTDTSQVDTITFQNFVYDDGSADGQTITGLSDFWTISTDNDLCAGTIHVTGTKGGNTFADYTARYRSGMGDELYDFIVDFGDFSQLTVTMNGYSSLRFQQGTATYENSTMVGGDEHTTKVITKVERTTVSWNAPVIAKGGAAE